MLRTFRDLGMADTYRPLRVPLHPVVRGCASTTRWSARTEPLLLRLDGYRRHVPVPSGCAARPPHLHRDWRGFGRSEWPADGSWFPDYYADLDALLERFAPDEPVTLIGHSMGGNIATLYAGIRPERVRRAVCIGFGLRTRRAGTRPVPRWLQLREPRVRELPSLESFARFLERRNPRLTAERAAFIAQAWTAPQPDGSVRVRADPAHKRINPVLYRREEAEACWREVTAPVLYVVAEQSDFLPRLGEDGQPASMARLIRRLEPCAIPDASHMVHHERPELLARAIEAFLERT
jgi:pimeloyl-ACP methyl ester carboxylesterase